MSKLAAIIVTLVALGGTSRANPSFEQAYASAPPPPAASNLWFEVGEQVIYNIYWGVIHVGTSHVTTDWVTYEDGRTLLSIRFESRSNKAIAMIYPVEDVQHTLIDPESFLPVVSYKKSRQGRRRYNEITRFDHEAGKAYWESVEKEKKLTVDIESDTRDLISLMYLTRSRELEVGSEETMRVFTSEKIYDLFLKVPRKEPVKLKHYGEVESLLIDPEAAFDGLFVRKGKVYLWISDDDRRLCTKIDAEVPVARVHIEIDRVLGPGDDFWVKAGEESPEAENRNRGRSSFRR
ncbi:MAG: DUF3108 domain-containing protein [Kiritimatiellia bacterium]